MQDLPDVAVSLIQCYPSSRERGGKARLFDTGNLLDMKEFQELGIFIVCINNVQTPNIEGIPGEEGEKNRCFFQAIRP